ncbi:MAG: amino-acid N-acetyltransferase [Gammaproteobacteria bacterium]|nr:amino-acid N-acetyltransferase [Gammaproteobacteria bacterium]
MSAITSTRVHDSPPRQGGDFVRWFRSAVPYINAFRNRTFVVAFGGELLDEGQFEDLVNDIALLNSLGVRLVLVHGARPQIERELMARGAELQYVNNLRVTDDLALDCVKRATGAVRIEIEARLSQGLANSPLSGARIRVASGNFVTARPLGIRGGVDYRHTGEVRRIDGAAIDGQLDAGAVVVLSPLGYSPTGEVFNLAGEDVAVAAAAELKCDKLVIFIDGDGLRDANGNLLRELSLRDAETLAAAPGDHSFALDSAIDACRRNVRRVHLLNRNVDGAILVELFTRDGLGSMVTVDRYEGMRHASIDDIGGILDLIKPLEREGILVRRSRELLETEIGNFVVVERDGAVIACAALYPFDSARAAELACLVVHADYREEGRGAELLDYVEREAKRHALERLFVLTTRTSHWFRENGFDAADTETLPVERREFYNNQRKSQIFVKELL